MAWVLAGSMLAFAAHAKMLSKEGACECYENFAVCRSGWGEHGAEGCGRSGKSCADICPGDDLPYKPLYRAAIAQEATIEAECGKDPTAKWGPNTAGTQGPFAVAFSGGMRNFAATWHSWQTNLVEPSGGDVHVFFHIWMDENTHHLSALARQSRILAQNLPQTKGYREEPFQQHVPLLHAQEPGFGKYVTANADGVANASWLTPVIEEFPPGGPKQSPYVLGTNSAEHSVVICNLPVALRNLLPHCFSLTDMSYFSLHFCVQLSFSGPGFSQFRKVHLCMQLVREYQALHNLQYSLVLRARPDHCFILPMDLRDFTAVHAKRPSVKRARGHFLAVPERHQGQLLTDHFAMGTAEAMWAYGEKPLPYTLACCEGYVQRNIDMRCFVRNQETISEELSQPSAVEEAFRNAPNKNGMGWSVVPSDLRTSRYSPLLNNPHTLNPMGALECQQKARGTGAEDEEEEAEFGGCIPTFRPGFMYIYNINTAAWLHTGAVCIGRYAGADEEKWILGAGLANGTNLDAARKHGFGPCLTLASLAHAYDAMRRWLATLSYEDRKGLLAHRGRR